MSKELVALVELGAAIVEVIRSRKDGFGVPGGELYSHVMNVLDVHAFDAMMKSIVKTGLVRKEGECYFYSGPEIK